MIFESGSALHRTELFLENIYEQRIERATDAVIPVVGGEGVGKSTLILQLMALWRTIAHGDDWGDIDYEQLFGRIHSTRNELQQAMVGQSKRTVVAVPDAGRVLYRKEAMHGEQVDLEKDFFDVRYRRYVFLLGFQDWGQLPDFLASRRASHAIYIPRRGAIWGYSRSKLDERVGDGRGHAAWPEPDLKDRYPALDGTDLWEKYQEFDEEEKQDRMGAGDESRDPESVKKDEQARIALRLTKPWSDGKGMTQREAAKYIDYSRGWISDRVQDWKDGEYEEAV
jgi:hypothetical protein